MRYIDPDGRILKVIDEPLGNGYTINSPSENRLIIERNLSAMAGCKINIEANGNITMGEITKTGPKWDAVRARLAQLINDPDVVGITTNTDSITGWGFNPIYKDSDSSSKVGWARRNGISAYIQVSSRVTGEYKHINPNYNFFSFLFGKESKYLYGQQTPAGATAHEVLGHAVDFVTNAYFFDEYSALKGENLYHDAANELSRDIYP